MIFEAFENKKNGALTLVGFENEADSAKGIPSYIETGYENRPGDLVHDLNSEDSFCWLKGHPPAGDCFAETAIGKQYLYLLKTRPNDAVSYLKDIYAGRAKNLCGIAYASPYHCSLDGYITGGISVDENLSDAARGELGYGFFALDRERNFQNTGTNFPGVYMFLHEPELRLYDYEGNETDISNFYIGSFRLSGHVVPLCGAYRVKYPVIHISPRECAIPVPIYNVSFSAKDMLDSKGIGIGKTPNDLQHFVNESRLDSFEDMHLSYDFLDKEVISPYEGRAGFPDEDR